MKWQNSEINHLKQNYHKYSTFIIQENLCNFFGNDRTINQIRVKAHRLGLKRFSL